jgi:Protein of unknown function (DUF2846)
MKIAHAALALVLALVAGCASGPKHSDVAGGIPTLKSEDVRIYFYRSNSMLGAAIQPTITLNGQAVGDSKPGGFFYVDTKPGSQVISTSTEVEKTLTFIAEAGQTRYVKTTISMGLMVGRVYPELVDTSVGANDIKDMSYIGKPMAK